MCVSLKRQPLYIHWLCRLWNAIYTPFKCHKIYTSIHKCTNFHYGYWYYQQQQQRCGVRWTGERELHNNKFKCLTAWNCNCKSKNGFLLCHSLLNIYSYDKLLSKIVNFLFNFTMCHIWELYIPCLPIYAFTWGRRTFCQVFRRLVHDFPLWNECRMKIYFYIISLFSLFLSVGGVKTFADVIPCVALFYV